MKTINSIQLLGYVGKDSTLTTTNQGLEVAGLSIATSTQKKGGDKITQWHNCVAFGKTAELVGQYAKKGARIYVEGEMQYSEYEKDGVSKISAKVVINNVSFIDFLGEGESMPRQQSQPRQAPKAVAAPFDSDIPF